MSSLLNKVILITGASTGIGGYTATYLSQFKPKLVLVARSENKLEAVRKNCESAGVATGNVLTIVADMAKLDDLNRVVKAAVNKFGQLDVLINNAAAFHLNDMATVTPEIYDSVMSVNVRAPFFLSQAAAPHLKKTQGTIINISSIAAHKMFPETAVYSISKAALEHATRLFAIDLAPSKVRVNAITVGVVRTDTQELIYSASGNPVPLIPPHPLGICNMEDVAKVITFLASDQSSAMTGSCIPVDRGALIDHQGFKFDSKTSNLGLLNPIPFEVVLKSIKKS